MGTTTAPDYPSVIAVETEGTGYSEAMIEHERLDIVTRVEGDVAQLEMRGALDIASAPQLISTVHEQVRTPVRRIDVDCDGVELLDSAGVRALIVSRNEARRAGVDFGVVDQSRVVRRVLERIGLSSLLVRPS
jgi:anti-anti-sigma factor